MGVGLSFVVLGLALTGSFASELVPRGSDGPPAYSAYDDWESGLLGAADIGNRSLGRMCGRF